ncbi:MAG: NTP transferase domain-containing protein [Anaerolineales bacterium]|jgi:molybdopterin-guanine dinucleotide biosynthesis protein A
MDAIVLAGGTIEPTEPLFELYGETSKALIPIAGRPMVQWVIDALSASQRVDRIVLIGLEPNAGLQSAKEMDCLADNHGILANARAGLEQIRLNRPDSQRVLLASCDIPAITPEIVDWRIEAANQADADLDYAVVSRQVMEQRFPSSRRSFLRIRGGEYCGGDLNVVRIGLVAREELWDKLIAARKNVLRQASLLGWDLLLLTLTRMLTLESAERKVSKRLQLKGRATVSPFAELAMDADKPEQLLLLEGDLSRRAVAA